MAHTFYIVDSKEQGTTHAREHLDTLEVTDIDVFSYGLFSIEDARTVTDRAYRTSRSGKEQGIIIAVERMFHEAQNALLKVFEEPPAGTFIVLVVPSSGVLLDTLRSRLTEIKHTQTRTDTRACAFLDASSKERSAYIEKVVARSKSDKQQEKDGARSEVRALVEQLLVSYYALYQKQPTAELQALLSDLETFMPILSERSAPLKLILEHISLVIPRSS